MKKILLILFLTPVVSVTDAQNVNFVWAKQMGGTGECGSQSVAVDAPGNVYTTGFFKGVVDFDPGPGVFNMSAVSVSFGNADIFISKLDADGNFVWAKQMVGSGDSDGNASHGNGITVDAQGNIYTTGAFNGTVDFDPGPGVFNLSASSRTGIFVSKLNATGNFVWAKQMVNSGLNSGGGGSAIKLDISGNIYTTGSFAGTIDFDPGPGTYNLSGGGMFVSKLDATGNFIWAKQIQIISSDNLDVVHGFSIVLDASGNIYTTGGFVGTVDFDPGPGVYNYTSVGLQLDIFVSKLDAAGNFLWAKQFEGVGDDWGTSIAIDAMNNVYTTGVFNSSIDFDPGPGVFNLSSIFYQGMFVSKLDSSGNFVWAKKTGDDSTSSWGNSIATDVAGNVYTSGSIQAMFVSKLDAFGNIIWTKQIGGRNQVSGTSMALDASGNIYTTGWFEGQADFDPGPGIYNLTSIGTDDIFVHKLSQCTNSSSPLQILNANSHYCPGSNISVTAVSPDAINFLWEGPNSFISNGATLAINNFQSFQKGYYKVTAAGTSCGSVTDSVFLGIRICELGLPDTIHSCGDSFFLDAGAGYSSYRWNTGDTTRSLSINNTGLYWVQVVTSNGTPGSDTTYVDLVNANIVQNDTAICYGNNIVLFIGQPTTSGNTILPPGSQFEYTFNTPPVNWTTITGGWTIGNAPFGNETNGFPPEFNYNTYWPPDVPNHPDGYDLYLRKNIDLTGFDLSSIQWHIGVDNGYLLYINGHPVDSAYAEEYTERWEYNGVFPSSFLQPGNNIIAIALVDNGGSTAFDMMIDGISIVPGQSILWSSGETSPSITVTPPQSTTYYVTVTQGVNVCTDSVRVNIKNPAVRFVNATICEGDNYEGYIASGIYVDTLVAKNGCDSVRTIDLLVNPKSVSGITQIICSGQSYLGYNSSGIYIDTLVAKNGCDSIRTLQLTVLQKPVVDLGIDKVLCTGDSLILFPGKFNNYLWQDGTTQNQITVRQPGLYSVVVTDNCGTARDEIFINEGICDVYFPTAFTPNNDGKNDLFKVLGSYKLKDYHLTVYNRWGQKVFETTDYTKGWTGTVNKQPQNTEVFVWYCEFKKPGNSGKTKMKGTVVLIN